MARPLAAAAEETGRLVVAEDHWPEGGLGDAVLAALADRDAPAQVTRLAVTEMPHSGMRSPVSPVSAGGTGITAGAELWRQSAPVLRAIVENWRTDPRLEALWTEQMQTFTDATVAQINADPRARQRLAGQDIPALASALTWLGERVYYLAATGVPPFDDQDTLVATLLHIWITALYEDTSTP